MIPVGLREVADDVVPGAVDLYLIMMIAEHDDDDDDDDGTIIREHSDYDMPSRK